MTRFQIVRVGSMGSVGRYHAPDAVAYPRGASVIVRSSRGLEIGEVLGPCDDIPLAQANGTLLRGMTIEDELLNVRLSKNREAAYQACAERIFQRQLPAVLMDVEHLFDGRTLIFHFLGEMTPELDAITDELTELYDANVSFRQFAETLEHGCGPGCGSDASQGGGCGDCGADCAIAGACSALRA